MGRLIKNLNQNVSKYLNTRVIFAIDMVLSFLASLLAILATKLFIPIDILGAGSATIWLSTSLVASFFLIWSLRTYRIIIRHMTIREFGRFVLLSFFKVLVLGFIYGIAVAADTSLCVRMASVFLLTFAGFFFLRMAMLLAYDYVKERMDVRKNTFNVLIYGVGVKSVSLIPRLQDSSHYNIVGFLQFGKSSVSHVISEKKTFYVSTEEEFNDAIAAVDADAILFATEEEARLEKDRMIKYAIDLGIKMLFAPPIDEMVDGKPNHSLRNIEIEDLLMRPEIKISMEEIIENFKGKTVMVTGAAGSIGSELCRQLATFGIKELVLYDNSETPMHNLRLELEEKFPELNFIPVIGDVRLLPRLDYAFRKWRPQVGFHAAAYKHVPLME